jgi:hypothetical protein
MRSLWSVQFPMLVALLCAGCTASHWSCPVSGLSEDRVMDGAKCSLDWACGEKTLRIECKHHNFPDWTTLDASQDFDPEGSYDCRCLEGQAEVGSFSVENACPELGTTSEMVSRRASMSIQANTACGWRLPEEYAVP